MAPLLWAETQSYSFHNLAIFTEFSVRCPGNLDSMGLSGRREWHLLSQFGALRTVPEYSKTLLFSQTRLGASSPCTHLQGRAAPPSPPPALRAGPRTGVAGIALVHGPPWRGQASPGSGGAQSARLCRSSASPTHAPAAAKSPTAAPPGCVLY